MSGLRVIEQHPGTDPLFPEMSSHGFHFHLATTDYLMVDVVRSLWERLANGGRIHVKKIPKEKFMYLGKYLAKQRGMFHGVRQWSTIGLAERVSARDIIIHSHWNECYKFLNIAIRNFAELPWKQRLYLVTRFSVGICVEDDLKRFGYTRGIELEIPKHFSQD